MSATKKRRRGERADGRIQVTLTIGRRSDGKPEKKVFYGKTRLEAERKRDEYKRKMEMGFTETKMTVDDWIAAWISMYNIDVSEYCQYINRIKARMGSMHIDQVREAHLYKTLEDYSGKSKSAATKYRMIIKRIFSKARKNRIISHDPSEDLPLPDEITQGSHRALERWETDCIMKHWQVYNAGLWAMLMLLCGLRRGEMAALDWDAIDLDNCLLTVRASAKLRGGKTVVKKRTKTEAGMRKIPICEPLYNALNSIPVSERSGAVCTSARGGRITETSVKKGWATYCKAMTRVLNGEPPLQPGRRSNTKKEDALVASSDGFISDVPAVVFSCRPHDLRHTFATALYDAGVDVKAAQYYLGHADAQMTINLYTHLSVERENIARNTMVNYLDKWLLPVSVDDETT